MSVLDNIKDKINESKSVLILAHENPDGDAIGSSLGLYNALKKIEKQALVYIPVPDKTYNYLPGYEDILYGEELPNKDNFDLVIALDSSDIDRLGIAKNVFSGIDDSICIDHHITNQNFADINYINAVASSTCENIMVVLAYMGIAIDKDIASCLYTGILTDTGAFRYNTNPETMEMVATIMETGINTVTIYRRIYDVTTFNKTKLVGRCIDRMVLFEDGKIAFTNMYVKDLEELNLEESDTDLIVNYGKNIDSVEVSVFAKERADGTYKISIRANEYVDVSIIASKFGGGGHARAAGFETSLELDKIQEMLVSAIKKQLK